PWRRLALIAGSSADGSSSVLIDRLGCAKPALPPGSRPTPTPLPGGLAACALRLRRALALQIQRHGRADQLLQRRLVQLLALADVDGAPRVPLEAGVEQTRGILQRCALRKGHLHHALVRLARADEAAVGPDGRSHPL